MRNSVRRRGGKITRSIERADRSLDQRDSDVGAVELLQHDHRVVAITRGLRRDACLNDDGTALRAVVFVTAGTAKGTSRSAQEYVHPLLVLFSFGQVHRRICDALRGNRPRTILEEWSADGSVRLVFEDGGIEEVRRKLDS